VKLERSRNSEEVTRLSKQSEKGGKSKQYSKQARGVLEYETGERNDAERAMQTRIYI